METRKLDYELLERWIEYMEKPTDKYKYKEAWQAMMKRATAAPLRGRSRRTRRSDAECAGNRYRGGSEA